MTNLTYTDGDLRAEAARQYAEILRAPDRIEVQDEMQGKPIPSRSSDGQTVGWIQLGGDDFHDAVNEVHRLLDGVPDLSRWAVDLSASYLKHTTKLAWGHGDNWALAVQVAHRPRVDDELHTALVEAIRRAVNRVLDDRGIDTPELEQHDTRKEAAR